jgi:diguanylate cyclase (GGDEF)-like protein
MKSLRLGIHKIVQYSRKLLIKNNKVSEETPATNSRRVSFLAAVTLPISLAYIIAFLFFIPVGSETETVWRSGILLSHITLAAMMCLLGSASLYLRKRPRSRVLAHLNQYTAILSILSLGIAIAIIDQLVTPNITPFLIACTATALVFLIRPLISLSIYLLTYLVFYFSLRIAQTDPTILLSNQMNGLAAIGIGICLSFILWNNHSKNFFQKICIAEQQKELEARNSNLAYLASYDSMTGIMNRRKFEKTAEHEISRMARYQYHSILLILDIDHFKKINDRYGHPCGDRLICECALILKRHLRDIDVLARWGGEEFIILLPRTGVEDGTAVAQRLRKAIEDHPFSVEGTPIKITTSFGISQILYFEQEPFKTSYEKADQALYQAKKNGRNRIEVHIESLTPDK